MATSAAKLDILIWDSIMIDSGLEELQSLALKRQLLFFSEVAIRFIYIAQSQSRSLRPNPSPTCYVPILCLDPRTQRQKQK